MATSTIVIVVFSNVVRIGVHYIRIARSGQPNNIVPKTPESTLN